MEGWGVVGWRGGIERGVKRSRDEQTNTNRVTSWRESCALLHWLAPLHPSFSSIEEIEKPIRSPTEWYRSHKTSHLTTLPCLPMNKEFEWRWRGKELESTTQGWKIWTPKARESAECWRPSDRRANTESGIRGDTENWDRLFPNKLLVRLEALRARVGEEHDEPANTTSTNTISSITQWNYLKYKREILKSRWKKPNADTIALLLSCHSLFFGTNTTMNHTVKPKHPEWRERIDKVRRVERLWPSRFGKWQQGERIWHEEWRWIGNGASCWWRGWREREEWRGDWVAKDW